MSRYIRQMSLSEIGTEGQQLLRQATVLIVGCGALGSIAAMYLAGAGVGRLILADFDNVDITNLQRQLSFSESDIGKSKAEALGRRIHQINSETEIVIRQALIRNDDIEALSAETDVVIDASDNPASKSMLSRITARIGIPCVTAGVDTWRGQVMTCAAGSMRWCDVFPQNDEQGFTPCSIAGVIGPVPGIMGSIQAVEAIKLITGAGEPLTDKLLLLDALNMQITIINLHS